MGREDGTNVEGLGDERLALNQSRLRTVNEAIERGLRSRDEPIGFACECGRLRCTEILELGHQDYEAVRSSPRRFVIVDGHQTRVDETVDRLGDYAVVLKTGEAGAVAESLDPRKDDAP
jgi:hypothetical protein